MLIRLARLHTRQKPTLRKNGTLWEIVLFNFYFIYFFFSNFVLQMTNVQSLIAVALSGIAFVFAVIGTAIPYWAYASDGDKWGSSGLWQRCVHQNGDTDCVSLTYNTYGIELTGEIFIRDNFIQDIFMPNGSVSQYFKLLANLN